MAEHDVFANISRVFDTRDGRDMLDGWLWCHDTSVVISLVSPLPDRHAVLLLPDEQSEHIILEDPMWGIRDGESYCEVRFTGEKYVREGSS
jgi:hypothetical protein